MCRNVCQPKWPTVPISSAAGFKCALQSEPGLYGSLPDCTGWQMPPTGGPLPAVAPGSIVEEKIAIRDTAPFFAAGTLHRWIFGCSVFVNTRRGILIHSVSLPGSLIHLLPVVVVVMVVMNLMTGRRGAA